MQSSRTSLTVKTLPSLRDGGSALGLKRPAGDGGVLRGLCLERQVIQRHDRAEGRVGRDGRNGEFRLAEELPVGIDLLQGIDLALAGVGIQRGGDDGEGTVVPACAFNGQVLRAVIPLSNLSLHLRNGLRDGVARAQTGKEDLFPLVVIVERDGLGIAVEHAHALGAQRGAQAVRRHAEADGAPDQAVRGGLCHVVRNAGAVHGVVFYRTVGAHVLRVVGIAVLGIVLRRQAGAGLQQEVGRCRAGDKVLLVPRVFIVRGAVAVEDDNAARLDGGSNGVDRGARCLQDLRAAARGGGQLLYLVLILHREAAVQTVIRLDERDIRARRRGCLRLDCLCLNAAPGGSAGQLAQARAVGARHARRRFKAELRAAPLQRAVHIEVGGRHCLRHGLRRRERPVRDVLCGLRLRLLLHGVQLGPQGVDRRVVRVRQRAGLRTGGKGVSEQGRQQCQHQQKREKSFPVHMYRFLPVGLLLF